MDPPQAPGLGVGRRVTQLALVAEPLAERKGREGRAHGDEEGG